MARGFYRRYHYIKDCPVCGTATLPCKKGHHCEHCNTYFKYENFDYEHVQPIDIDLWWKHKEVGPINSVKTTVAKAFHEDLITKGILYFKNIPFGFITQTNDGYAIAMTKQQFDQGKFKNVTGRNRVYFVGKHNNAPPTTKRQDESTLKIHKLQDELMEHQDQDTPSHYINEALGDIIREMTSPKFFGKTAYYLDSRGYINTKIKRIALHRLPCNSPARCQACNYRTMHDVVGIIGLIIEDDTSSLAALLDDDPRGHVEFGNQALSEGIGHEQPDRAGIARDEELPGFVMWQGEEVRLDDGLAIILDD